jgi:hypothetical protein
MRIVAMRYTNASRTQLDVETDRGRIALPWPCETWHREPIEAWLAEGNEIAPYEPPPEPEPEPDLARALADALIAKGVVSESDLPEAVRSRIAKRAGR